jgi:hypothetical protein
MANVMSKQEMFNKAVIGLATQGFRQAKKDGPYPSCNYEIVKDGVVLRCAYSHTMTDDFRKKVIDDGMNGSSARDVIRRFPEEAPIVDTNFESDLQRVHDMYISKTPDGMKDNLKNFAARYGLELPDVLKES